MTDSSSPVRLIEESPALLEAAQGGTWLSPSRRAGRGTIAAPKPRVISIGKAFKGKLPLLSTTKVTEAQEMAEVYPYLFLLENSIRDVIRRAMEAKFGADWWNTALTGQAKTVKTNVEYKLKKEDEQSWHQRRGAHPIDYTTLGELKTIAVSKPDLFFPRLLGTKVWFEALIDELEPSRNVLAHMNPLSKVNAAGVRLRFDHWQQHLIKREAELTAAMTPPSSP